MTTQDYPRFTKEQEAERKAFWAGWFEAVGHVWDDLKEAGAPCTMEAYNEFKAVRVAAYIEQWNNEHQQDAPAPVETVTEAEAICDAIANDLSLEEDDALRYDDDNPSTSSGQAQAQAEELTAESLEAMVEEDMICEMLGVPYPTAYNVNDNDDDNQAQAPAVPNHTNERKRKARKPRREDAVQLDMFDAPQQSGWKSALCLLGAAINVTATVLTTIACVTVGLLLGARP